MIISKYRGFTAAAIKSKADIPAQADMTIIVDDVDCRDIPVSDIRRVLKASTSKVRALARNANVNVWSGFGPTVRSVVAEALVNSLSTEGGMEDFAGYNHQAVTPGWLNAPTPGDIWIASGGSAVFDASLVIGEVRWNELGIIGVVHAIYDGATLVAYVGIDFDDDLVADNIIDISVTLLNQTITKTYTGKVFLVSHLVDYTENDNVCRLPNTTNYTRQVRILPATTVVLDAPVGFTAMVGFTNSPNFGTVWYTNLEALATYDEVRVYASIWGYREGPIGSEILIDTFIPWHHDDFADGSGQPNGEYFIYANGYICTIRVEAINY